MRKIKSLNIWNKIPPANARELYFMAKQIDNFDSEGSFLLATLRVFKYYLPSYRQLYYEPLTSVEDLYKAIQICHILNVEHIDQRQIPTISIDFECFKSIYDTDYDGIVPMPTLGDRSIGRHAVEVLGEKQLNDSIYFINKWSKNWGKDGFGYLTPEYLKLNLKEIYFCLDASIGVTDENFDRINAAESTREFSQIWIEKNGKDSEDCAINGKKLNIVWYSLISVSGAYVEIFDLRDHDGQRLGWAHLTHLRPDKSSKKASVITEIFIWPTVRRKNYGSLLESYCFASASAAGSIRLRIPLYEMDDLLGPISPIRFFCEKLGYNCTLQSAILPCLNGYAEKNI